MGDGAEVVRDILRVLCGRRAQALHTVLAICSLEDPDANAREVWGRAKVRLDCYDNSIADVERAAKDAGLTLW